MTQKFKNKYRIDSARLKGYDYGNAGAYFITICTHNRQHFFGACINGKMQLNDIGIIAFQCWNEIPEHFSNIAIGEFIIMPNHTHGIIIIDDPIIPNPLPVQTLHATSPQMLSLPQVLPSPEIFPSLQMLPSPEIPPSPEMLLSLQIPPFPEISSSQELPEFPSSSESSASSLSSPSYPMPPSHPSLQIPEWLLSPQLPFFIPTTNSIQPTDSPQPADFTQFTDSPQTTDPTQPSDLLQHSSLPTKTPQEKCLPNLSKSVSRLPNSFFQSISPKKQSIPTIIRSFKSAVTKLSRPVNPHFQWQTRFHDHIIRSQSEYDRIEYYIMNNPQKWKGR